MVTIKDVAKLAGVAVSTASIALNGDKNVSASTKAKVLSAAQQLNYQKNGFASDLKRSRSNTIVLILSDLSGPYYSELIQSVQEVATSKGYDLIACSSIGGKDSTAVRFLKEFRADGVIILAHNISDEIIVSSAREGFPIVVLDRELKGDFIINVMVDGEQGGYIATEYLIQKGHKKIAYIGGPAISHDNKLRYQGYLKALQEYDLQESSKWNFSGKFTRDGGYTATKTLLVQGDLPTAIFYANDEMALGGMKALSENQLSVPEDISIIGFDDIVLAGYVNPPLTTIKQPKYEAGALAAHLLFQVLDGQYVKNSYTLTTGLVERATCQTPKV